MPKKNNRFYIRGVEKEVLHFISSAYKEFYLRAITAKKML